MMGAGGAGGGRFSFFGVFSSKATSPVKVQRRALIAPCADGVCPRPCAQQLSGEEWDYSRVR